MSADGTIREESGAEKSELTETIRVNTVSQRVRVMLGATTALDGILILVLALRDFTLTKTGAATLGSGLLLAIALVNLWASYCIVRKAPSWLVTSVLGQLFAIFLGGYIVLIDVRSPTSQMSGATGLAIVLSLIAVAWVIRFGRHVTAHLTKGVAVLAVLLPLLGLFQYWLETDYIPRTSRPQVDITTELTPIGRTGSVVHLVAKITLHNRGSIQANVAGTLMRITAYPRGWPPMPIKSSPENVSHAMDFGGNVEHEFRADSTPGSSARLLYADDFLKENAILPPGITVTLTKAVDIDSNQVKLARLSVSASFLTQRRIKDITSCDSTQTDSVSMFEKFWDFSLEVSKLIKTDSGGDLLCMNYEIAPRNVVQELVSDAPVLRVYMVIEDPSDRESEYPQFGVEYGTEDSLSGESTDFRLAEKIDDANPTLTIIDQVVEFAPSDAVPAAGKN